MWFNRTVSFLCCRGVWWTTQTRTPKRKRRTKRATAHPPQNVYEYHHSIFFFFKTSSADIVSVQDWDFLISADTLPSTLLLPPHCQLPSVPLTTKTKEEHPTAIASYKFEVDKFLFLGDAPPLKTTCKKKKDPSRIFRKRSLCNLFL